MAVDGGQFSDFLLDLASVYELAGHALLTAQQLTSFLFHQAEGLRLIASNVPRDEVTVMPLIQAYATGSKSYLTNVIEGGASTRRRKNHGVLGP